MASVKFIQKLKQRQVRRYITAPKTKNIEKGRRPGFDEAAQPQLAERLYQKVIELIKKQVVEIQTKGCTRFDAERFALKIEAKAKLIKIGQSRFIDSIDEAVNKWLNFSPKTQQFLSNPILHNKIEHQLKSKIGHIKCMTIF